MVPGDTPDAPDGAPPLPPRVPHPLATHIAIDTAVTLLATFVVGWFLGVPILVIVAVAIVAGLCLAPFTRRTELHQLAERDETGARRAVDAAEPPADDES